MAKSSRQPDRPDDIRVEFVEILSRDPKLGVMGRSDGSHLIAFRKRCANFEFENMADAAGLHVPVASNFFGIP